MQQETCHQKDGNATCKRRYCGECYCRAYHIGTVEPNDWAIVMRVKQRFDKTIFSAIRRGPRYDIVGRYTRDFLELINAEFTVNLTLLQETKDKPTKVFF